MQPLEADYLYKLVAASGKTGGLLDISISHCVFLFLGLLMAHHRVTVENNHLIHLAQQLPNYLIYAREENTISTYMTAFRRWQQWSSSLELATLPANPTSIALCILNQIQMDVKYSSIHTLNYGISLSISRMVFPTQHKTS